MGKRGKYVLKKEKKYWLHIFLKIILGKLKHDPDIINQIKSNLEWGESLPNWLPIMYKWRIFIKETDLTNFDTNILHKSDTLMINGSVGPWSSALD